MLPARRAPTGPHRRYATMQGHGDGNRRSAARCDLEPGCGPGPGSGAHRSLRAGDRAPEIVLGIAIVVWALTFSILVVPEARPVRVGRLRHGHPRPERVAPGARPRLHDRPGPPGVRPPRDARLLPLRPLLLDGRRAPPPQHHPGVRRRPRRGAGVPAGAVPDGQAWAAPLGIAFLLHPALQFFMSELFHPEVIAITPLLCADDCSVRKRWGWFACSRARGVLEGGRRGRAWRSSA